MALQRGSAPPDGLTGNVEARSVLASRSRSRPPGTCETPMRPTPRSHWLSSPIVLCAQRPPRLALKERARGIEPPFWLGHPSSSRRETASGGLRRTAASTCSAVCCQNAAPAHRTRWNDPSALTQTLHICRCFLVRPRLDSNQRPAD